MNGTDYNRIAELWERLGALADKADGLHMEIYRAALFEVMDADRADGADGEYRGKCRSLLDEIERIERQGEIERVTAGDTGTAGNLRRQLCALRDAVNTLADYPGEEEARKPGPTGQELIDEAWERYFDEESSRGFPCDKALDERLEREVEAIHHRPGWGVFAPEIMHDNLILVLGRIRLECRKGEAEARKHIWAKLDGIAGGVEESRGLLSRLVDGIPFFGRWLGRGKGRGGPTPKGRFEVTQEDVAKKLGVDARTVRKWEAGEGAPPEGYSRELRRNKADFAVFAQGQADIQDKRQRLLDAAHPVKLGNRMGLGPKRGPQ